MFSLQGTQERVDPMRIHDQLAMLSTSKIAPKHVLCNFNNQAISAISFEQKHLFANIHSLLGNEDWDSTEWCWWDLLRSGRHFQ